MEPDPLRLVGDAARRAFVETQSPQKLEQVGSNHEPDARKVWYPARRAGEPERRAAFSESPLSLLGHKLATLAWRTHFPQAVSAPCRAVSRPERNEARGSIGFNQSP